MTVNYALYLARSILNVFVTDLRATGLDFFMGFFFRHLPCRDVFIGVAVWNRAPANGEGNFLNLKNEPSICID